MARQYKRPVKRYPKPHGFVMPKPGDVKPGTIRDRLQLDMFNEPKRLAGDYVAVPLSPDLATQLLEQQGARFSFEEREVLRLIGRRFALTPDERETLNAIFTKLEPRT